MMMAETRFVALGGRGGQAHDEIGHAETDRHGHDRVQNPELHQPRRIRRELLLDTGEEAVGRIERVARAR